eukprot:scaffold346_cov387-Prasinococcus_capsulatus_cf.AAC.26
MLLKQGEAEEGCPGPGLRAHSESARVQSDLAKAAEGRRIGRWRRSVSAPPCPSVHGGPAARGARGWA